MKLKVLTIIAASMLFVMTISSSAFAAWYTATVNKVGGTDTGVRVQITDDGGAFSKRWFNLAGNQVNQIYSAVLTAAGLEKKLSVQLNSTEEFSDMLGCYLIMD